jgi:molybdopterin/thiamine biosynthesis adenylyltransferase/molybdopterin synthase catalytic subunit/rhodanese-related sulfurtransferase
MATQSFSCRQSRGAKPLTSFRINAEKLDCAALSAAMADAAAGGFVSFEGWVRNANEGHDVTALDYEVFRDLAVVEGARILEEAVQKFGLRDARAVHREGKLAIGDCAVWVGITARHRGEAFEACRFVIDEIKHRLPVWKKEYYVGLEPQWVNCQHTHHPEAKPAVSASDYYARQMRLPELGAEGQAKLGKAKILVVGIGGLGSAAAIALAGSGIGTIGLADHDVLSASNLHRQLIYSATDIGQPKADLAAARLRALNPLIEVETHAEKVTAENVEALFARYDLVLDCTDNFTAKYLLNDAAILFGKPVVQASIYRFEGQLLTIDGASTSGCLRCLFPEPPPAGAIGDCAETGVLGAVPALFGTLQASEAIKRILGLETLDDLLMFDLLSLESRKIARMRDENCALCGAHPFIRHPGESRDLPPIIPEDPGVRRDDDMGGDDIDFIVQPDETGETLRGRFTFIDVREDWELEMHPVPDALHMPTSAFDLSLLTKSVDEPLLLICAKGVRSRAAAEYLRRAGWARAYNLVGGVDSLPMKKARRA